MEEDNEIVADCDDADRSTPEGRPGENEKNCAADAEGGSKGGVSVEDSNGDDAEDSDGDDASSSQNLN